VIETARLHLRVVDEDDAAAAVRLITPEVSRWLSSWPSPLDQAAAALRFRGMRDVTARGDGLCLAIEPRDGGEMMGLVMIMRSRDDARRAGLGYWLGEPYHHQGYMIEAATAAVAEAFARLRLEAIEAGAQPANAPSLAIMRRLGMRPIGERPTWAAARGREEICAYYEITRDEHDAHRAADAARRA
jgi:[ribosomal protein S5]-alanine N-acetyltransferase